MKTTCLSLVALCLLSIATPLRGLDSDLANLDRHSSAKSRSVSPENFTGEKGRAAMAGTNGSAWNAARELCQRFSLYRWQVTDPVRFENDLKVTIQALGWQSGWRYLPLEDDISSVAFWY